MKFFLCLNRSDRRAIDWIGSRYAHGDDFHTCLMDAVKTDPDDIDWDADGDITYTLNYKSAIVLRSIVQEDDLACFGKLLRRKLLDVVEEIDGELDDVTPELFTPNYKLRK